MQNAYMTEIVWEGEKHDPQIRRCHVQTCLQVSFLNGTDLKISCQHNCLQKKVIIAFSIEMTQPIVNH